MSTRRNSFIPTSPYFKQLSVDALRPGRYQPRKDFEAQALAELADSILNQGMIEPLVVREITNNHFEIIAGERRWRAAILAGLSEVPCMIGNYSDRQACALTLIENIQRQDLNLIEEASGYKRLSSEFHYQQDEIATLVGKSRSHVANIVRLLTLCEPVQDYLKAGSLSLGHARMLVGLSSQQQISLARESIEQQWSVRELEANVKQSKSEKPVFTNAKKDKDIERLELQLAEQIGAPVKISSNNEDGGWLQLKFFDNDTLAGLLERLGLSYD